MIRMFTFLSFFGFLYAHKMDYNSRPVKHSSSGLSLIPAQRSNRITATHNFLSSSESAQKPVTYKSPAGFGGYQTEFYTFTAPEDVFDDHAAVEKLIESINKKVRVIFIKNPENTAYENAILSLIRLAGEQKTVIYILNKQTNLSDLAGKLNDIESAVNHKPEVHFVKYRTPDDAYNAQRAIQSQYNSLDGSAENYNAGHVPVLNFASPPSESFPGSFQTPSDILHPIFPRFSV